jgi:elongation factor Tu
VDLVELEVRELLSDYGFPGDEVPVVHGSALGALDGDPRWEATVLELMDAVDRFVPTPKRDVERDFLMPIEAVHTITGLGTVVTGRIERGVVRAQDAVEIIGGGATIQTVVRSVEIFHMQLDRGEAGDQVGLLLRGVERAGIERGQVVARPRSIAPHTKFRAEIYVLPKEEGGRHTPFFSGYQPQFFVRTADVPGVVTLPEGVAMVMPGDTVTLEVELAAAVALEPGLTFAIREGGHTVGAGAVASIVE